MISRTFSAVFHCWPVQSYMYGMWCETWLLMPSWPIRTSRASSISWIVPP